MVKDLQSRTLDYVRFPLAVIVVFIHCYGDISVGTSNSMSALFYENTRILFSKMPQVLVNSAFFIFAAHLGLPLLPCIRKAIEHIIPNSNYYLMTLRYFVVPICLVCCCLLIYLLLSRFLPRTTKVICGR